MSVYSNSNPLRYTVITFNEELDVNFTLHGAGGGGGGHPDDIEKDYKGGDGGDGSEITGTVRVNAGDTWTVFVGGGGRRGLSWYLGGDGGLGGPAKAGYNGGAGGRMGSLGRSSGGGGGGGASVISINGIDRLVAAGGAGGGGEGRFSSGRSAESQLGGTSTFGEPGSGSSTDDGGGGGGGGGGAPGGRGGSFGSGDTGGHGGYRGTSFTALDGVVINASSGAAGGIGGSGDYTNNTSGADGRFVINSFTLPASRYTGIYTKDAGTWKQPTPSVKYNGSWTEIQEGYVKNNGKWVRVYPPKVSVEINDYGVNEFGFGTPVQWNETIALLSSPPPPPPPGPPPPPPPTGPAPTATNTSWQGIFNSINRAIYFPLSVNSVSTTPITSLRIVSQPRFGTVTVNGTTAIYTPNTNGVTPGTLSDGQAQTYVDYWVDLFPNGITSTAAAKSHWVSTGQGEGRYIPEIRTGADSFTWTVTNQYGESNVANCTVTFSAPSSMPLDNSPPTIVSNSPTGSRVSTSTGITFDYSEQVYPGTGSITVTGTDGSSFSITNNAAVPSGRTVNFQPGKLKSNTTYTVTVPSGYAKDIAGNPSTSASWSFTTADEEGPYVIGVAYVSGMIRVTWSEPITLSSGAVEVIGPYYANGDIESISHVMTMGSASNETIIEHSIRRDYRDDWNYGLGYNRYYWGNRNYSFQIDSDAVRDYSGNPNEWSNHGFYSDYLAQPQPPVTPVPVVTAPVVVTPVLGTDTQVYDGRYFTGFYITDLWLPILGYPLGNIVDVQVNSVTSDLTVTGGQVNITTTPTSTQIDIPTVTDVDDSSTSTNVIGIVDTTKTGLLDLTVQPDIYGGIGINVTSTVQGLVNTVPLNVNVTATTSEGLSANTTIPVTVDLSNQTGEQSSPPALTFGGYDGFSGGWKFTLDDFSWNYGW